MPTQSQYLAPSTSVIIDFINAFPQEASEERVSARAGLLTAIISTRLVIYQLQLLAPDIVRLTRTLGTMEIELESFTSSVQRLYYVENYRLLKQSKNDRTCILRILRSAHGLRRLDLLLCHVKGNGGPHMMPAGKLLATDLSQLEILVLGGMSIYQGTTSLAHFRAVHRPCPHLQ